MVEGRIPVLSKVSWTLLFIRNSSILENIKKYKNKLCGTLRCSTEAKLNPPWKKKILNLAFSEFSQTQVQLTTKKCQSIQKTCYLSKTEETTDNRIESPKVFIYLYYQIENIK